MTVQQHAERPAGSRSYIPKTLDAVAAAIEGYAVPDVVAEFHAAFAAAWQQAKAGDSLMPLNTLVAAWWPAAAMWEFDPAGSRHAHAETERVQREGPGPDTISREEAIASWERAHGRKLG